MATLSGTSGNDILVGGDEADTMFAGEGDDSLDGGVGNDFMSGDRGNDTYLYRRGAGRDVINDYGGFDTVVMEDILPQQVTLTRENLSVVVTITGTPDRLMLQNFFYDIDYGSGSTLNQIEKMVFADGTIWTVDMLADAASLPIATEGDDSLYGNSQANTYEGRGGNDVLDGYGGDDVLDGGDGDDSLQGGEGSDRLVGGAGNDTLSDLGATGNTDDILIGGAGKDYMHAGGGDDVLDGGDGNDTMYGSEGNDTLDGGTGNDLLGGERGNDTYLFRIGAGQDVVLDYGGFDTVMMEDILPQQVTRIRDGLDVVLTVNGTQDKLTLQNFFYDVDYGLGTTLYRIEKVQFADGTIWGTDVLIDAASAAVATEGDDALYGNSQDNTYEGRGGNDTLDGAGGNDLLDGGDGDDTLQGGEGSDRLVGGAGNDALADSGTTGNMNDTLLGGDGNDHLNAGSGDDVLSGGSGVDTLLGGDGEDVLDGGTGDDVLGGELGNDTYLFRIGFGQDLIREDGGFDTIVMEGLLANQVSRVRDANDVVLTINGTADRLTLQNFFYGADQDPITTQFQVERVLFADGTSWNADMLAGTTSGAIGTEGDDTLDGNGEDNTYEGRGGNDLLGGYDGNDLLDGGDGDDALQGGEGTDRLLGGAGNDYMHAGGGDDTLTGGAGDDTMYGSDGSDTLDGGTGNDLLGGERGDDTYLFRAGAGQDTIYDNDGSDTIVMEDILPQQVTRIRDGLDLVLAINGTQDKLTLQNFFYDVDFGMGTTLYQIEKVVFADGSIWNVKTLADAASVALATEGDDTLFGNSQDNNYEGLGGNDMLFGYGGNDVLDGGDGSDVLQGGDGDDVLSGGTETDQMIGGSGNDYYVVESVGDAIVEASGEGTDTVNSLISYTLGDNVENLVLAGTADVDGTGNALNNTVTGNSAANLLDGGEGVDTMKGGGGNDIYVVDNASDVVIENVNDGIDQVRSSVSYILTSNVEGLELLGAAAINGTGNAMNNQLTGNAAANILDGGAGSDTMTGGDGSDTYYVDNIGDSVVESNGTAATGGIDTVISLLGAYTLGSNVENGRILAAGAASLTGNSLNNVLYAGAGNNVLSGGSGIDTADYSFAGSAVTVSLALTSAQATVGSGSDTLSSIENLTGSIYNDKLTGNTVANVLDGGAGSDTMSGGSGDDTYYVDNVGDTVVENGSTGGIDLVNSAISAYTLASYVENGRILSAGTASLAGNSLNNVLYAGAGNNFLNGGSGNDTADYSYAGSAVTVSLAITSAQATVGSGSDTLASIENLKGSAFNDTLIGNGSANTLTGGAGQDTLTGGSGKDIFNFDAATDTGYDVTTSDIITDFARNYDKIDLLTIDANELSSASNEAFAFIGTRAFSSTNAAGQLRYEYDAACAATIVYGSTDADSDAEFAIKLTGSISLSSSDFVL